MCHSDIDCPCDSTQLHKDKVHLKLNKMTNCCFVFLIEAEKTSVSFSNSLKTLGAHKSQSGSRWLTGLNSGQNILKSVLVPEDIVRALSRYP